MKTTAGKPKGGQYIGPLRSPCERESPGPGHSQCSQMQHYLKLKGLRLRVRAGREHR